MGVHAARVPQQERCVCMVVVPDEEKISGEHSDKGLLVPLHRNTIFSLLTASSLPVRTSVVRLLLRLLWITPMVPIYRFATGIALVLNMKHMWPLER